jgi:hypothetical protein
MQYVEPKDPNEVVDYTLDWDDGSLATGETISSSAWEGEGGSPPDIDIDSDSNTTTRPLCSCQAVQQARSTWLPIAS